MSNNELQPQHIRTATLEATKVALLEVAEKGKFNMKNMNMFLSLFGDKPDRTEFINDLYKALSTPLLKLELEELCSAKGWEFNKDEEE